MPIKRKEKRDPVVAPSRLVKERTPFVLGELTLPTQPHEISKDLSEYMIFLYGREGIGKTKTVSQFPNCLFLCTEPGAKGIRVMSFNHEHGGCSDWRIVRKAVELIELNPDLYDWVCIDTADRAYDMCLDYVCEEWGIDYPGATSSGQEDYGKSWRAVKQEFLDVIHRVSRLGIGIVFISHGKEEETKTRSGQKYTKVRPTLGNQGRVVIEALCDFAFYGEYVRDMQGESMRIWITEGDDFVWAKSREVDGVTMPKYLRILKEGAYQQFVDGFNGDISGLKASDIGASVQTSKMASQMIASDKAADAKKLAAAKQEGN